MAIYHCSIKIGSRSKGQSAIAASAYRSGEELTDKQTGIVSDYTRKGGIVHSEVALCANAPSEYADREKLWNAVHEVEKAKNSQLWREFEVALPKELSRDKQIDTVREFVKGLTEQGMCVDWALHDKGDGNPHAHIMATVRSIKDNGEWAPKSKKVYDLDENGEKIYQGKDKSGRRQYKNHKEDYNNWNDKERVEEWREQWAKCCNRRLSERDHIDHRSYERQGIEQIPTVHEGYVARQMVARGKASERVQMNEEIQQKNSLIQQLAEQLRSIGEMIKALFSEKEKEVEQHGRIAELLARRKRTVDRGIGEPERRTTDGERRTTVGEPTAETIIAGTEQQLQSATDEVMQAIRERNDERNAREAERKRQAAIARERAKREAQEAAERERYSGPSL